MGSALKRCQDARQLVRVTPECASNVSVHILVTAATTVAQVLVKIVMISKIRMKTVCLINAASETLYRFLIRQLVCRLTQVLIR